MRMFFCNGKKDFCDERLCKDNCEFYDGSGGENVERKTNADRIQEKLAEVLSGMCKVGDYCYFCPMDGNCPGGSYDLHVWDNWLKQPAEGD